MGLIDTIRSAMRVRTREAAELDYLNGSTSRVDVEMRQRDIDRGKFRHLPSRR